MQMGISDWLDPRDKGSPRVPQPTLCIFEEGPCMMLGHTYGFTLLYGHATHGSSTPTTRTQIENHYYLKLSLVGKLQLPRRLSHYETRRSRQSFSHLLWERDACLAQQVGEYSGNPRNSGPYAKPARERDLSAMMPCLWRRTGSRTVPGPYAIWHTINIACLHSKWNCQDRVKRVSRTLVLRQQYVCRGADEKLSGKAALSMDRHERGMILPLV
ncbi:hypothetical protein ASPTUDRAFT_78756 [Aspergillus tubingensis CBS 134.48]|uniref:Uncharacterized protein n=1 Tax=Aspergillus tubingensis (strain CBS 134.48) TaxID=767770 RepID=A0A1L9MQN1_ASPTC|nr:hypothetical protein ASPTUDRAFT_78756 [Aspergillus tubingensis CBS 134.48]